MGINLFGRDKYLEMIRRYAESPVVGNQAFLGVKGVGKTSLFQYYFTKEKRKEIAGKFKKLFVFSRLDSRKQGSDLYHFLLDQVKTGIMGIPDENEKKEIKSEMDEIDEIFETPDGRLTQYLTVVKDMGYDLIIIMDQFHCMARDTEVGSEQYDVLRSFNEQKLITYWIITDTDLMETCATKQYIASFFAQKFTSKLTICPLPDDQRTDAVKLFASQKKYDLMDNEVQLIDIASGGVPELMSILIDVMVLAKKDKSEITYEELKRRFLLHDGGISLFRNWISGLNEKQKEILYSIALTESGMHENETTIEFSKLAELSDDVGRGLLHVVIENDERKWEINIDLFKQYILGCGDSFYNESDFSNQGKTDNLLADNGTTNITFNISGNYIYKQENRTINIANAITGLEDLQKMISRNAILLEEGEAASKLDCLPFKQDLWLELSQDEQEEELEKYADGIFSSDIFLKGAITSDLMEEFCINEDLLDKLSDACRNQIVCGIQVYNLIQICIDRFGLNMSESESPRGILFARAFERHLKDFVAPAYNRIPEMANHPVYPTNKIFRNYPIDKTTIGTYSTMLGYGYRIFAEASVQLLGDADKNEQWWKKLKKRLSDIGDLRNNCCHSGTEFGNGDLMRLKRLIFSDGSIEDVLFFDEIPSLQQNQFIKATKTKDSKASTKKMPKQLNYPEPDYLLLGKTASFKIKEKTSRGTFRGVINGKYEGSLPKTYAHKMDFISVKNTEIEVIVDSIQDGKYVLRKSPQI